MVRYQVTPQIFRVWQAPAMRTAIERQRDGSGAESTSAG